MKYWLRPDLENRVKAGEIRARWNATVTEIGPREVTIQAGGQGPERLPADRVYLLTGYHPDFDLFRRIGLELDPETGKPAHDPATLETTVPGVYLAGSVTSGKLISEVFIENGRYDGEKIFGDPASRERAEERFAAINRPVGE